MRRGGWLVSEGGRKRVLWSHKPRVSRKKQWFNLLFHFKKETMVPLFASAGTEVSKDKEVIISFGNREVWL